MAGPRFCVRYLDMTPTLVLGLMAVVAGRYIASGTNSNELYVLSGIGIALLIGGMRYFSLPGSIQRARDGHSHATPAGVIMSAIGCEAKPATMARR